MLICDIIRAAIPGASDATVDHVLWGRTPYPFKPLTARDIYRAASRCRRAGEHGLTLCDHCNRIAETGKWECKGCREGLESLNTDSSDTSRRHVAGENM